MTVWIGRRELLSALGVAAVTWPFGAWAQSFSQKADTCRLAVGVGIQSSWPFCQ